jgi:hypothetical protein
MYKQNGKPLTLDRPFTVDGVQYPANWLRLSSEEERSALGIMWEEQPTMPDLRFYWSEGNPKALEDKEESDQDGNPLYVKVLGVVDGRPAMVDSEERLVTKGLKSTWIAQVKDTAGKMLASTDWMVIRKAERGIDIPEATVTARAAIVAEAGRLETAIKACEDVPSLIEVVSTQNWGE